MDWFRLGILPSYLIVIQVLFAGLSSAEERASSISVEAEGWYAWWQPIASRDEGKGILTEYKIEPALLKGTAVSIRSEGRGFYALQFLTSQLEGEIKSKATKERRDKVIFDEFIRWRVDVLQMISVERYLYTKLVYGGFSGKAKFVNSASFATPRELDMDSQFVVADLFWMSFTEEKYLHGFGLRLMNYRVPSVTYTTSGDVITDTRFTDTEFRSYSLALSMLDGSRVSREGKSPYFFDDFILYLGYAESENPAMGKGKGLTVGIEGACSFKKEWEVGTSLVSFNVGVRLLYNLISGYKGDENNLEEVTSEDMFIGPYLNLRWVF